MVIPCNTAHYWFDALKEHTSVQMISIVDVVCHELARRGIRQAGLMATNATVAAGIYNKRIRKIAGKKYKIGLIDIDHLTIHNLGSIISLKDYVNEESLEKLRISF